MQTSFPGKLRHLETTDSYVLKDNNTATAKNHVKKKKRQRLRDTVGGGGKLSLLTTSSNVPAVLRQRREHARLVTAECAGSLEPPHLRCTLAYLPVLGSALNG